MKKFTFILPLALALASCAGNTTSEGQQQDSVATEPAVATTVEHKDFHGTIPAADAAVSFAVHVTLDYNGAGTYCERSTPQDGESKGVTDTVEGTYTTQGDTITFGEGITQKRALLLEGKLQYLNADNQPAEHNVLTTEEHLVEDCHH